MPKGILKYMVKVIGVRFKEGGKIQYAKCGKKITKHQFTSKLPKPTLIATQEFIDNELIYRSGNKDEVLQKDKVDGSKELVPEHYTEISLGGANHAGFGNYGPQEGVGKATMEREKQQDMTVTFIMKMIHQTYEKE